MNELRLWLDTMFPPTERKVKMKELVLVKCDNHTVHPEIWMFDLSMVEKAPGQICDATRRYTASAAFSSGRKGVADELRRIAKLIEEEKPAVQPLTTTIIAREALIVLRGQTGFTKAKNGLASMTFSKERLFHSLEYFSANFLSPIIEGLDPCAKLILPATGLISITMEELFDQGLELREYQSELAGQVTLVFRFFSK